MDIHHIPHSKDMCISMVLYTYLYSVKNTSLVPNQKPNTTVHRCTDVDILYQSYLISLLLLVFVKNGP